ncbi:oligopeptide:H+ symporter [Endozoicomonas numazuensis]|uniref:Peptide ABC transporter permease n=1 Tax=Endozoicomonas numazuensis TaxID=1137799 RepID=A0A081N436_9GAMM|nr:oligopeptide:H+ symporter [Endozoicomonas numazuensis]KEQ13209.1 peptide ABC transporter permease [Endozoicomonas numazuensis]
MSQSLNVLKQPRPFYLIFFLELWERFGYYGLQAILAVYLVRELDIPESESFIIFGAFNALVYGLVAIGGFLGDKVLGTKRTIVFGALVLMAGYVIMAVAGKDIHMVYLALGTVAVGNGLFKANPSSLLAKCYEEGDSRLDGAFTMYYMAINIGSFISLLGVPYVADHFGWGVGFMVSAIGLLVALANYFMIRHWVADYGSEPDFKPLNYKKFAMVFVAVIAACFACAFVLNHLIIANILLTVVGTGVILIFLKEIMASAGVERGKMIVALVLMLEAIVFWVMYYQMPTSLNFFTIHNVEHVVFGFEINPVSFQSLNPFWIMVASPVLAYLYNRSGVTGKAMSMPAKFALGMALTSVSFLLIPLAAQFASAKGLVDPGWIVGTYLAQSLGELLISGLGLAMVAQLVPKRMHGFIMGAWFLTSSAASVVAGYVAGFTAVDPGQAPTALETLPVYSHFFETMGLISAAVALVMFMTAPKLNKLMTSEEEGRAELATA